MGVWASTPNMGNIIGALLTSFLTSSLNFKWFSAYGTIGFFCTLFVIIDYFFLIVHPKEKNIIIEELS